jgi:hypothetical protein
MEISDQQNRNTEYPNIQQSGSTKFSSRVLPSVHGGIEMSVASSVVEPPQPGVFRKMRYVPANIEEVETPLVLTQKSVEPDINDSICQISNSRFLTSMDLDPVEEIPTLHIASRPQSPEISRRENTLAVSRRAELFRGSNPDFRRSFSTSHGRSSSPPGRLKDGASISENSRRSNANTSPRRSLSPRRGIVGKVLGDPPPGIFSRSSTRLVEMPPKAENDASFKEPAGAFRRRKNANFKPSIALSSLEDVEMLALEAEQIQGALEAGLPFSTSPTTLEPISYVVPCSLCVCFVRLFCKDENEIFVNVFWFILMVPFFVNQIKDSSIWG